jgi:hypothetical protein
MRAAQAFGSVRVAKARSIPRLNPLVRMSARLRATRLDAELASGTGPWRSSLLAARALQLTSKRSRQMLATSLERVLEEAQFPARRRVSSPVIAPCHAAVSAQLPQIFALTARLRSQAPVEAAGIAALRMLLSDGSGPIYTRGQPDTLGHALDRVARGLEVTD